MGTLHDVWCSWLGIASLLHIRLDGRFAGRVYVARTLVRAWVGSPRLKRSGMERSVAFSCKLPCIVAEIINLHRHADCLNSLPTFAERHRGCYLHRIHVYL